MKKSNLFIFDTNVLINAMLFPESVSAIALKKAVSNGMLVVSVECLEEFKKVCTYEKFDKYVPFSFRLTFLQDFEENTELIAVNENVQICRDPDDDKFLALAKTAGAAAIVSGDKDLLVLKSFENIPIVTPHEFLNLK